MSCEKCEKKISFKNFFLALAIMSTCLYGLNTYAKDSVESKVNRKALDAKTKTEVIAILKINESLHDAFFNYDAKKIEASAKELKSEIEKISNDEVLKLLKFSQDKLSQIKASSSVEENNMNYHTVSMALIHIINTYDVGDHYNAYSCPMVKKKWLQNSKITAKIHNPYASNMPHCGSQDTNY